MEVFNFFINVITSGVAWDAIKGGVHITGSWLKEQLDKNKFPSNLNQEQLDALATELQKVPSCAKKDPSVLIEYLNSHNIKPVIKEILQQSNQIKIGGDNSGVVVIGNVSGGISNK